MWHMNRKTRGAITVFMVIIYILVYALLGVLVDGGRVQMAKAEAEQVQQLANESVLANYDLALYQYYGLFGETAYGTDEMQDKITSQMQSALSLDFSGDIGSELDIDAISANTLSNLTQENIFDPYDLKVESIDVNANYALANPEVMQSQINDCMRYTGLLMLINNFIDIGQAISDVSDATEQIKECSDESEDLTETINDYYDRLAKQRGEVYSFIADPSVKPTLNTKQTKVSYDTSKDPFQSVDDKIGDAIPDTDTFDPQNPPTDSDELEEFHDEKTKVDKAISKAYKENSGSFYKSYQTYQTNAKSLLSDLNETIRQGVSLYSTLNDKAKTLSNKEQEAVKNGKDGSIYKTNADCYNKSKESLENDLYCLYEIRRALDGSAYKIEGVVEQKSTTNCYINDISSLLSKSDSVVSHLEDLNSDNCYDMSKSENQIENSTATGRETKRYHSQVTGYYKTLRDKAALIELQTKDDTFEDKLKSSVESSNDNMKKQNEQFQNGVNSEDRLGTITLAGSSSSTSATSSVSTPTVDTDKPSDTISELTDTMNEYKNNSAKSGIVNNLLLDTYVTSHCRDYVHTCKMDSSKIGEDDYDSVDNAKFRVTDTNDANFQYLTEKQYKDIETSCAEAEYVIYGDTNTKNDVTAQYATVFAIRLACNYVSVFLTPELNEFVTTTASASLLLAPVVMLLLPFAFALPQTIADMTALMQGMKRPVILNDLEDWISSNIDSVLSSVESTDTASDSSDKLRTEMSSAASSTSSTSADGDIEVKAGYADYLMMELMLTSNTTKVQRLQDIITTNMRKLTNDQSYSLSDAIVNVSVDTKCSVKFLFATKNFVPQDARQDDRYQFSIGTSVTY